VKFHPCHPFSVGNSLSSEQSLEVVLREERISHNPRTCSAQGDWPWLSPQAPLSPATTCNSEGSFEGAENTGLRSEQEAPTWHRKKQFQPIRKQRQ
jgi:nitric oxide synthase oxygenase domain/subunit